MKFLNNVDIMNFINSKNLTIDIDAYAFINMERQAIMKKDYELKTNFINDNEFTFNLLHKNSVVDTLFVKSKSSLFLRNIYNKFMKHDKMLTRNKVYKLEFIQSMYSTSDRLMMKIDLSPRMKELGIFLISDSIIQLNKLEKLEILVINTSDYIIHLPHEEPVLTAKLFWSV
jgi:hypothetical protein